ncbi:MAG TPA: site-specific integrase [Gemmataceae bacterium]|nr:site-specific integrase [Gemmataceae bacterium]
MTCLLAVALDRPLKEARTVRRGKRKGQQYADLRAETVARLDLAGREWALIYKTLVLTGLRRGELASLTVAQVDLAAKPARLHLNAADEKNREGSTVPIRADLAAELRAWITVNGRRPSDKLFAVPRGLPRILDRDLKAAGIAKRDASGRTLDVHALRHTFGTLLSVNGVAPRTAQEAMRHSRIDLTMNVYTDPKMLDVARAVDALPGLPLDSRLAPLLAPAPGNQGQTRSFPVNDGRTEHPSGSRGAIDVSSTPVNKRGPLSSGDSGPSQVGPAGFEPTTSCTPSRGANRSGTAKKVNFQSYEFHPSHILQGFGRQADDFSILSTIYPAQPCPGAGPWDRGGTAAPPSVAVSKTSATPVDDVGYCWFC